jgi:hypothetical protein
VLSVHEHVHPGSNRQNAKSTDILQAGASWRRSGVKLRVSAWPQTVSHAPDAALDWPCWSSNSHVCRLYVPNMLTPRKLHRACLSHGMFTCLGRHRMRYCAARQVMARFCFSTLMSCHAMHLAARQVDCTCGRRLPSECVMDRRMGLVVACARRAVIQVYAQQTALEPSWTNT